MSTSDAAALRKMMAWLCGRCSPDECRRALGLATVAELQAAVERNAKAGHQAVKRELSAQTPEEARRG